MTTQEGGPRTQLSKYPRFVVGVSANESLMEYMNSRSETEEVAQKIEQLTERAHDINMSEPVVTTDPATLKKLGFVQSNTKLYGKTPVIGQSGNFPHGITKEFRDTPYWRNVLSEADRQKAVRQAVMRHLVPFGVNQANYRKALGPGKTPNQDGMDVIIFGPATSTFFTGTVLPPMTEVALVPMPAQKAGRSGTVRYICEGVERYPFTVEPLSNNNVVGALRLDLASFNERLVKTGKTVTVLTQTINPAGRDGALLEADKNAGTFLAGIVGICAIVMEELELTRGVGKEAAARQGRILATEFLSPVPGGASAHSNALPRIIDRICGAAPQPFTFAAPPSPLEQERLLLGSTLAKSALALLVGSIQDTAAVNNRRFGKILQHVPSSKGYSSAATGTFDYDYLVG